MFLIDTNSKTFIFGCRQLKEQELFELVRHEDTQKDLSVGAGLEVIVK
jgi:hypothetical protein